MTRLARFAWCTLAYNIAVILWGAYVRASGSGAGCGSHWPLCNGAFVPRAAGLETLIEYSHRITSGVALVAVIALWLWTRRSLDRDHPARTGAAVTLILMLVEAAVGAGIVLFELVADNASMARALFMAVHLANTFFLLAALSLTAYWTSGGDPISLRRHPLRSAAVLAGCAGLILVGVSGAVAALGDTLYPSASLSEALAADLSSTSHILIRLRVLHPALAIVVALVLAGTVLRLPGEGDGRGRRAAQAVVALAALQLAVGLANVTLLAPVWLQMAHLLIADLLWISYLLTGASALSGRPVIVADNQRVAVNRTQRVLK